MDSLQKEKASVPASTPVPKFHIVKEVLLGRIVDETWQMRQFFSTMQKALSFQRTLADTFCTIQGNFPARWLKRL